MDTVYKVVKLDGLSNKHKSANIIHIAYKDLWDLEYSLDTKTVPPSHHPNALLFAFEELAFAERFANEMISSANVSGLYIYSATADKVYKPEDVLFLCGKVWATSGYIPLSSNSPIHYDKYWDTLLDSSDRIVDDYNKLVGGYVPPGTVLCTSITLRKLEKHVTAKYFDHRE